MKKILVVDDNKEVRHTLEALLVKEGYYVETLTSGYDIVGYMQNKERPDAIILDLMLPGRSGLEILNSVKNKWPDTLIYIFSAHPEYRTGGGPPRMAQILPVFTARYRVSKCLSRRCGVLGTLPKVPHTEVHNGRRRFCSEI